ncbi:MAG: hypothetical protein NT069_21055 [Planctomycetota bacterium]|nr:hypothetical protein [Planctomycetota bacterium]
MSRLDVPCPQCGKLLTIPDKSLLGKKGKCPRCQHKFLLQLPPENITFQEAREPDLVAERTGGVAAPAAGTPSAARPAPVSPAPVSPAPVSPPPRSAVPQADQPFDFLPPSESVVPAVAVPAATAKRRRRRGAGGVIGWIVVASLLIAGGGGSAWWSNHKPAPQRKSKPAAAADTKLAKTESRPAVVMEGGFPHYGNPTKGKAISLRAIPLGARLVIHLRPAELWKANDSTEEFLSCLGPLAPEIEKKLTELCLFKPQDLESVVLAFIPVSREAFEVSVVVRTVADFKRSDLITRINGELIDLPRPHFVGPQRVFLIQDSRTFASAPKEMKETFLEAAERPLDASEGLETLLSRSDASRQFTLVAELEKRIAAAGYRRPNAQKLLRGIVDFFGDDVESVCWSFQLGDAEEGTNFYSDLMVRNLTTRSPANLAKDLKKKLATWPNDMLDLVYKTRPETVGHTKLVGRFPVMTKVIEQSLEETHTGRTVTFTLELPAVAAPNLAAGTLLAWDYTTRPSFGKANAPAVPTESLPQSNLSIADRLKKPINVEFKNEFLFKTLEFIGGEIGVKFRTDGPGMQRVGVTQNMRQDMKYENRPVNLILHEMLVEKLKERELCIWIDEAKNEVVVTSQVVAEEQKRPIFPLKPQ